MKVMQIIPRMDLGGTERGVLDLVKFFNKKKHPSDGQVITNIVVSGGGRLIDELKKEGITHYQLPVYKKSLEALFLIPRLRKIIDQEKVDIVHARSRVPGWLSFFASRRSRACFITTAHGVYKKRIFSEVMGWGKKVIAPSRVVARHMKNNFGVPEEKIVLINRWVDLDKFRFTDYPNRKKSNVVVSIGRISPSKGYEYLIEAFKRLARFNPYLKLKIVGSADKSKVKYLNHLKTLVRRFSLDYNVEFVGLKEDVESVLADACVLVAPSVIEESFGRVVIESFACGVPVVATNVGGFKEIINDGIDGVLVEPANSAQIAEGIIKILDDYSYAEKLVRRAREKVEKKYTLGKCLAQTKEVYKQTNNVLKILVIKISSLGDLILSLPSLKEMRAKFHNAEISLLTLKKYHPFFYDCPYIDEVITLEDKYKRFRNILDSSKVLRRKSFDYIVDLQNNHSSHLISFFSFPRYSFGYSLRWGFLLTKKIKYDKSLSPLDSQERVLRLLGVKLEDKKLIFWPKNTKPSLELPSGNLIGINVSASSRWQSKNWPFKNLIKLIELIYKNLP
ncbi:MAG: glycosyltransferase, partial [Omnitrophica bacterium]|nr:glycosyltransferase [Candidatus Omnitrophota bacterium]